MVVWVLCCYCEQHLWDEIITMSVKEIRFGWYRKLNELKRKKSRHVMFLKHHTTKREICSYNLKF